MTSLRFCRLSLVGDAGLVRPGGVVGPPGRTVGTTQVEVAHQAIAAESQRSGEPRRVARIEVLVAVMARQPAARARADAHESTVVARR